MAKNMGECLEDIIEIMLRIEVLLATVSGTAALVPKDENIITSDK